MKTNIAFVTNKMIMGGIEKSLITILENIPKDKFNVTVYVADMGGELLDKIPGSVEVKYLFGYEKTVLDKVLNYVMKGRLLAAFKVIVYTLLIKRGTKSKFQENLYYTKMLPIEPVQYDIAIAFYIPASLPVMYVMKNINAIKKAAWIHSDVTELKNVLPLYTNFYNKYNHIFGVSQYTAEKFAELFPHLKERTSVFYNIIDEKKIKRLAQNRNAYHDEFNGIRILTVGRLANEKGQDIIPGVLLQLLDKGLNIRWYCLGDGELRTELRRSIRQNGLEENMILLGTIDNPYPFIKDCDIYIQTSRHESYCMTVAEARVFNKPIITTNTGASEQIIHGKTGLITECNEENLVQATAMLVNDELLRNKFKKNLSMETVDTTQEMEKLYEIAGAGNKKKKQIGAEKALRKARGE